MKNEKYISRKDAHKTAAYHLKRCIKILDIAKIDLGIIQLLQKYVDN